MLVGCTFLLTTVLVCCARWCYCFENVFFEDHQKLAANEAREILVTSGKTHVFYIDANESISHVVFQAHTQWHAVNISFFKDNSCSIGTQGKFSTGTNVGVVSLLRNNDPTQWCLSLMAQHNITVNVLLVALTYSTSDPIPGGCNQDLPLENDPNLYLTSSNEMSKIHFAYGNINSLGERCGSPEQQHRAVYNVYQCYLQERRFDETHYMEVLKDLLSADGITRRGYQITRKSYPDKAQLNFAAYTGQGVIYAVVMHAQNGSHSRMAAYVPVVTYACNHLQDNCLDEPAVFNAVLVCVLGILGLTICMFGHKLFMLEMYVFGHLAGQLIAYILIVHFTSLTSTADVGISLCVGVVFGCVWMFLWAFIGSPILSMLLVILEFGYLISAVIFQMTPLGVIDKLLFMNTYHGLFYLSVTIVVLIALLLVLLLKNKLVLLIVLNQLSSAVIGSYLVVLTVDWFLHGGIRQIALNSIRKSAIPGFAQAYTTVPFQLSDMVLCGLWAALSLGGFIVQYYGSKKRRQFPVPWCLQWRLRRSRLSKAQEDESEPFLESELRVDSAWRPGSDMWHPDELVVSASRDAES